MIVIIIILVIIAVIAISKARRKSLIEELKQLILMHDTGRIPYTQVESFCRDHNFSDSEYHEIRKNYYYEAAESDDIHSLRMAAVYASNEDRKAALKYTTRAAELGDVDSMYSLGISYRYDDSCPEYPNAEKAFYWFEKASQQGHEKSVVEVASAYRDGEGVEEDVEKSFNILKDYSDRGYAKCSMELAFNYYGSLVSPYYNQKLAEQTYTRVMQRGDPELFAQAANRLGHLYGGCYIYNSSIDEFADRRKAAYCLALAHFVDSDLYDTDDLIKVGYQWTEHEMRGWHEDALNLRYNPM